MYWCKLSFFLALVFFLVGCNSAAEPVATPPIVDNTAAATAAPTAEPTPAPAESSPTAVSEPATPTLQPTDPPATSTAGPTSPTPPPAQAVDSVQLTPVAAGFLKPLGLEHAGDGRLFVVQQPGLISVIDESGSVLETPFLDIRERVNDAATEQGLLGLAFHPNYAENGRFFVNYTRADDATVVAAYQVSAGNPNTADPNSEQILLTIPQPFRNHNGGQIRFGPDGYLYIGMGDGGSRDDPQGNAQNPGALLGTLLRIDVDQGDPYGIPADNPFVDDDSARNEIWAIGLRNPWRFTFDRATGDLFIADVGQNQWEEIDFQPAGSTGGENYGWPIFEASNCYLGDCNTPGLVMPVAEYNHAGGHCSVTGGYVYRGRDYPALTGNYFFADYCSGVMWRLFPNGDGTWDMAEIARTRLLISSFGQDVNGELYVVDQNGPIYRLTP